MKNQSFNQTVISLVTVLMLGACAQDGGGSGDNRPSGKPQVPLDCNQAWSMALQAEPKGRMTQYENKTYVVDESAKMLTGHMKVKTTIKESDSTKIVKLIETQILKPSGTSPTQHEDVMKKTDFLRLCSITNQQPGHDLDMQTRVIGVEQLNVKAGQFSTTHYETILNQNNDEMRSETKTDTWFSTQFPNLVVKSATRSTSRLEESAYTTLFESELVAFEK